jgi:hypothetical protein
MLHQLDELEIRKRPKDTTWCVFADYSVWIYGLAIQLTDTQSTAVYILHPNPEEIGCRLTDSIVEFADLYLDPEDNETASFWASAMILSEDEIRSFKLNQAKKHGR